MSQSIWSQIDQKDLRSMLNHISSRVVLGRFYSSTALYNWSMQLIAPSFARRALSGCAHKVLQKWQNHLPSVKWPSPISQYTSGNMPSKTVEKTGALYTLASRKEGIDTTVHLRWAQKQHCICRTNLSSSSFFRKHTKNSQYICLRAFLPSLLMGSNW